MIELNNKESVLEKFIQYLSGDTNLKTIIEEVIEDNDRDTFYIAFNREKILFERSDRQIKNHNHFFMVSFTISDFDDDLYGVDRSGKVNFFLQAFKRHHKILIEQYNRDPIDYNFSEYSYSYKNMINDKVFSIEDIPKSDALNVILDYSFNRNIDIRFMKDYIIKNIDREDFRAFSFSHFKYTINEEVMKEIFAELFIKHNDMFENAIDIEYFNQLRKLNRNEDDYLDQMKTILKRCNRMLLFSPLNRYSEGIVVHFKERDYDFIPEYKQLFNAKQVIFEDPLLIIEVFKKVENEKEFIKNHNFYINKSDKETLINVYEKLLSLSRVEYDIDKNNKMIRLLKSINDI